MDSGLCRDLCLCLCLCLCPFLGRGRGHAPLRVAGRASWSCVDKGRVASDHSFAFHSPIMPPYPPLAASASLFTLRHPCLDDKSLQVHPCQKPATVHNARRPSALPRSDASLRHIQLCVSCSYASPSSELPPRFAAIRQASAPSRVCIAQALAGAVLPRQRPRTLDKRSASGRSSCNGRCNVIAARICSWP